MPALGESLGRSLGGSLYVLFFFSEGDAHFGGALGGLIGEAHSPGAVANSSIDGLVDCQQHLMQLALMRFQNAARHILQISNNNEKYLHATTLTMEIIKKMPPRGLNVCYNPDCREVRNHTSSIKF